MENLYLYVRSNPWYVSSLIFCFKVAMAANSKMADGLKKIIKHQKCFRIIIIDIRSKMASKIQNGGHFWKMHIDSKHKQFTLLQ